MPLSRNRRGRSGRRVQRTIEPIRTARRGLTNKFYIVASVVIAILVIAGFALPTLIDSLSRSNVKLGATDEYVKGVGVQQAVMDTKDHVDNDSDPLNDIVTYNSNPPTSGDHWSSPQSCGFYESEVVPDEKIVHNLEHSNIVISYNLNSPEDIDALKGVYDGLGATGRQYGVARRSPDLAPGQVGLSAWGVNDVMEGVDQDRIEKFFDTYVGALGPEGAIPCVGSQQSMPSS